MGPALGPKFPGWGSRGVEVEESNSKPSSFCSSRFEGKEEDEAWRRKLEMKIEGIKESKN